MVRSSGSWNQVKFGEVVRLVKETCKDPTAAGIERAIGLEHLEPGDLRIRSWSDVASGTTFTTRVRPGQVLFGKRRAYQRKVAVADFNAVCSGDIYVLESANPERLLPELLPFVCQTDSFFEHAVGTSAGSLSPRTNWSSLAEYEFSLPPVEDQLRLAGTLQAVRNCREALREAQHAAEVGRRSLLFSIFRPRRGPVDHFPPHWRTTRVGEVGDTQVGIRKHPGSLQGPNMRPYLRVANVLDGWIDWGSLMEINVPDRDLARCALRDGDILINKGNSMNLVGRPAIFRSRGNACFFQDHLMRFRAHDHVHVSFAQAYFQHLLYTLQFTRIAVASTSIATIPSDSFEALPFPLPPYEEQLAIAQRLEGVQSAAQQLEVRLAEQQTLSHRLSAMMSGMHP